MFWSALGQAVHMLFGGNYETDSAQKAEIFFLF